MVWRIRAFAQSIRDDSPSAPGVPCDGLFDGARRVVSGQRSLPAHTLDVVLGVAGGEDGNDVDLAVGVDAPGAQAGVGDGVALEQLAGEVGLPLGHVYEEVP